MSNRFHNPRPAFMNATPAVYASGVLRFYTSGTSTPANVYSSSDLTGASTTVTLNSAGRPAQDIWLSNALYKVTLEDSLGNIIWTVDPYYTSDYSAYGQFQTYPGSPNGNVAGTAGTGTIPSSVCWDRTNSILYVCTTTGVAAAAVWTAVNAAAATPSVVTPQGYLTPTSATPIIAADVTSATSLYYTPFTGNLVPIYNGSSMIPTTFSELTLTLAAQHALNSIYDVFVFLNSGVVTLATGPAWTTITAGAGARGTGAATTQLSRTLGYWTNTVSIAARNGATTYNIGANLATYLGSIYIDGTAGQVSCNIGFGSSRKWGIWNAYNKEPVILIAGDTTGSWTYNTATVRPSNNATTNSLTVFSGLPDAFYDIEFSQRVTVTASNVAIIGIGVNSTTTIVAGSRASHGGNQSVASELTNGELIARHILLPTIGINTITALESSAAAGGTQTMNGTSSFMRLQARWRG